ncbi:MAG: DUF456 domain-containing protein [Acidimicrobiia bacterium]|nr:DUF456 domain-containing protein [Acidimicrobiia bacterium]
MNGWAETLIGLVILIGLVGIVVPVLPGLILIVAGVLVWALEESTTLGWIVLGASIALAVGATVVKYLIPGKRLKDSGVPTFTMFLATIGAIVGFFVIPVLGAPIGFLLAIYLVEWRRAGREQAWPATLRTSGAIALSIGIELTGGLLIAGIWLAAVVLG